MAKREILGVFKSAIENIADCSTPIQLRGYFNKYRGRVLHSDIKEEFYDRIEFFRQKFEGDRFYAKQLDALADDIEFDTLSGPKYINIAKHDLIDISAFDALSSDIRPLEESLLRELFTITNGLKSEVIKVLKTNSIVMTRKIEIYKLAKFISQLRREHRMGTNFSTQFPDT